MPLPMRGDRCLNMLGGKPTFAPRRVEGFIKLGKSFAHLDLAQQRGRQTQVRFIHATNFFGEVRAQLFCVFWFG